MISDELLDALKEYIMGLIGDRTSQFRFATWVSAEAEDPNLSRVSFVDGTEARGVPKLSSASDLTNGTTVLCISPGAQKPLIILGKLVGDVRLFGV